MERQEERSDNIYNYDTWHVTVICRYFTTVYDRLMCCQKNVFQPIRFHPNEPIGSEPAASRTASDHLPLLKPVSLKFGNQAT